jgi:hypothetical protein
MTKFPKKSNHRGPPNVVQVVALSTRQTEHPLVQQLNIAKWPKKLTLVWVAKQLQQQPWTIRKVLDAVTAKQPEQLNWRKGHPGFKVPLTDEQVEYIVSKKTLVEQVGKTMNARCLQIEIWFGVLIKPWRLAQLYRRHKIQRQLMATRLGGKVLKSWDVQEEALATLKAEVEAAEAEGYLVLQLDEALFTDGTHHRKHFAPVGDPIKVSSFYNNQGYRAVCVAIHPELGLVWRETIDGPFTQWTIDLFLRRVRAALPGKKIAVLLDNARIHHAPQVKLVGAPHCGIRLIYNCPYRPDCMGAEFYWKVAKARYYALIDAARATMTPFMLSDYVELSLSTADPHSEWAAARGRRNIDLAVPIGKQPGDQRALNRPLYSLEAALMHQAAIRAPRLDYYPEADPEHDH